MGGVKNHYHDELERRRAEEDWEPPEDDPEPPKDDEDEYGPDREETDDR